KGELTAASVRRDAGTMVLTPTGKDGLKTVGKVVLSLDRKYGEELAAITGEAVSPTQQFGLFADDLPLAYARQLKEAGYKVVEADLLKLRHNGISADYAAGVRRNGYDVSV